MSKKAKQTLAEQITEKQHQIMLFTEARNEIQHSQITKPPPLSEFLSEFYFPTSNPKPLEKKGRN